MKERLIKLFFGESVIRHYSSVAISGEIGEHVYLQTATSIIDVSENQWLLSLDPVVMGIWVKKTDISAPYQDTNFRVYFTGSKAELGEVEKKSVAIVNFEFFQMIEESGGNLILLTAKDSSIYHVDAFKTFLLFFKFYKKPNLSFNQFKSLVATHSYPRRVRVISFKDGNYYNIFPMDLLGDISQAGRFVFGLRHSNHSLLKIIETKKIVVSEFSSSYKNTVYQLGKHHLDGPISMDALPFKTISTEKFKFFIPEWVESYKEINIRRTINLGSHMLLWGEPVHEKILKPASAHLFHIPFLLYLYQKRKGLEYPPA